MGSQALPQDGATAPSGRRRRLLGLAASAAAAAGASLVTGRGGVAEAEDDRQLVGSWMVAVTPPGAQPGGPARLLVSFTGDGVALRTAPLQQAAPPALGSDKMFISTTHGEWARTGDRDFGLTFVGFAFDDAGKFLATQRIRVAIRVDEASDFFSGPFKAGASSAGQTELVPLSRREQEVAALVTEGLSNPQIAARLGLSDRTIDAHLRNIMGKLDVSSRAQVAAWIVGHGLAVQPPDGGRPASPP